MADEFELKLSIVFMPPDRNKADALIRVRKYWRKVQENTAVVCCLRQEVMKELYNLHHVGGDRMLYLIQKVNPDVTRGSSEGESIDSSASVYELEEIQVDTN